ALRECAERSRQEDHEANERARELPWTNGCSPCPELPSAVRGQSSGIIRCGSDLPGSRGLTAGRGAGASFTPIAKTVRKADSADDGRAPGEASCKLARHYRKIYLGAWRLSRSPPTRPS